MKSITFILIFCIPSILLGQNFTTGNYCDYWVGYCLEFHEDSIFLFRNYSNHQYGCGNYDVKDNTLKLQFTDYNDIKPQRYLIRKKECQSNDSVRMSFRIIDGLDNTPISSAEVKITDEANLKKTQEKILKQTNFEGNAEFNLKRNNEKNVQIFINDYKWHFYTISFETNIKDCQDIDVILLSNEFNWVWESFDYFPWCEYPWEYIVDTIKTFNISKIKKRKIILTNKETQGKLILKKEK